MNVRTLLSTGLLAASFMLMPLSPAAADWNHDHGHGGWDRGRGGYAHGYAHDANWRRGEWERSHGRHLIWGRDRWGHPAWGYWNPGGVWISVNI
jgi:hypothetical protein